MLYLGYMRIIYALGELCHKAEGPVLFYHKPALLYTCTKTQTSLGIHRELAVGMHKRVLSSLLSADWVDVDAGSKIINVFHAQLN